MLGSEARSGKRLHEVQHTPVSGKGKSAIGRLLSMGRISATGSDL
jgi:hypothetical protein